MNRKPKKFIAYACTTLFAILSVLILLTRLQPTWLRGFRQELWQEKKKLFQTTRKAIHTVNKKK